MLKQIIQHKKEISYHYNTGVCHQIRYNTSDRKWREVWATAHRATQAAWWMGGKVHRCPPLYQTHIRGVQRHVWSLG